MVRFDTHDEESLALERRLTAAAEESSLAESSVNKVLTNNTLTEEQKISVLTQNERYGAGIPSLIKLYEAGLQEEEVADAITVAQDDNRKFHYIAELLIQGYDIDGVQDVLALKLETDAQPVIYRDSNGTLVEGRPRTLKHHLSYKNILFLDNCTGDTHDIAEITRLLTEVEETAERFSMDWLGIGSIINKMRELYETSEEQEDIPRFPSLLMEALNVIPQSYDSEFDNGRLPHMNRAWRTTEALHPADDRRFYE